MLNKGFSVDALSDFSWEKTIDEATANAPLLVSCLKGAVTTKATETSLQNKSQSLIPRIGTALSVLLNSRGRLSCRFFQTTMSVQLWRGKLKREFVDQLSRLGLCTGYEVALKEINCIKNNNVTDALKYKADLEKAMGESSIEQPERDLDDRGNMEIQSESVELEEPMEPEHEEEQQKETHVAAEEVSVSKHQPPGFTFCWDIKKVESRHTGLKNKYLNLSLGFMAINRVQTTHLDWRESLSQQAASIPLDSFLPNQSDFDHLNYRMRVIVGRILCQHLPWFRSNFLQFTTQHIVHSHTTESTRKSVLVNLGVIQETLCSTQSTVGININFNERLQQYVPIINNVPVKTVVFDGISSGERYLDAQVARSNGLSPYEQLEAFEPAAQEYNKEMHLLQDFYDKFFKASSSDNIGTLGHIKNLLDFRQVRSDIADNFSHAWELMCITVESFVCLLVMRLTKMQDVNASPSNAPKGIVSASPAIKSAYFEDMCQQTVEQIWQTLDTASLKEENSDTQNIVCCGQDMDDYLIGCEAGSACSNGEFFHLTCTGVDPDDIPIPWYCSDACRQPYCHCGQDLGQEVPMISCSLKLNCTKKEWYHMNCVGIDPKDLPKDQWYCSDDCSNQVKLTALQKKKKSNKKPNKNEDLVRKYSETLLWVGLNLLCRRDAVREAHGEAMMAFWRLDLIHFFGNENWKCTILAHRLLAAINGWMPEKIKQDLIHNRTVNYSGELGQNLALDELLNRLLKDFVESAKGRYPKDMTIQNCTQIAGPLKEALDSLFKAYTVKNRLDCHQQIAQNRDANVGCLIEFLADERLFENVNGRRHPAFPEFEFSPNPRRPGSFAAKMKKLSKRLDRSRKVVFSD